MSGATFDFKLKSNRKEVLRGSEEAVERGLAAIGMRAVTYTHRPKERGGTPVDTGRLRNSIAWATASQGGGGTDAPSGGGADDRTVIIGTNVEYGEVVEEGTSKRKPAHMLRNALTDGSDEYARIMEAALKAT
jgi:HK97 gp10 family phage protein